MSNEEKLQKIRDYIRENFTKYSKEELVDILVELSCNPFVRLLLMKYQMESEEMNDTLSKFMQELDNIEM